MSTEFLNRERILRAFNKSAEYEILNSNDPEAAVILADTLIIDCDEAVFGWDIKPKKLIKSLCTVYSAESGYESILSTYMKSSASFGELADTILIHSTLNTKLDSMLLVEKLPKEEAIFRLYRTYCSQSGLKADIEPDLNINRLLKSNWDLVNWLICLFPELMPGPVKKTRMKMVPSIIKWQQRSNIVGIALLFIGLLATGGQKVTPLYIYTGVIFAVVLAIQRLIIFRKKYPPLSRFNYIFIPGITTVHNILAKIDLP